MPVSVDRRGGRRLRKHSLGETLSGRLSPRETILTNIKSGLWLDWYSALVKLGAGAGRVRSAASVPSNLVARRKVAERRLPKVVASNKFRADSHRGEGAAAWEASVDAAAPHL